MKKYLFLFLYLFIASLNYNLILKPLKLVTGGTQGLLLIITSFINIKDSIVILLINVTTLILSYFLLSKNVTKSIVVSSFLYTISIKITSFIPRFTINNTFIFSSDFISLFFNKKYSLNNSIFSALAFLLSKSPPAFSSII